jgi:hypothetical protein
LVPLPHFFDNGAGGSRVDRRKLSPVYPFIQAALFLFRDFPTAHKRRFEIAPLFRVKTEQKENTQAIRVNIGQRRCIGRACHYGINASLSQAVF